MKREDPLAQFLKKPQVSFTLGAKKQELWTKSISFINTISGDTATTTACLKCLEKGCQYSFFVPRRWNKNFLTQSVLLCNQTLLILPFHSSSLFLPVKIRQKKYTTNIHHIWFIDSSSSPAVEARSPPPSSYSVAKSCHARKTSASFSS